MRKYLSIISTICLIMSICFVFVACDRGKPAEEPFQYSASTLLHDGYEVLDFYSTGYTITKLEDNSTISPATCLYDESNEEVSEYISDSYEFWTHCESGGDDYSTTNGSVTLTYTMDFDGKNCTVTKVFYDSARPPTSSARRIETTYNISFTENHISITYRNSNESLVNEKKHFVDIFAIDEGIFIQHYKVKYFDSGSTSTSNIYKYFSKILYHSKKSMSILWGKVFYRSRFYI